MIPVQIKITEYNFEFNTCNGMLQNGNYVCIDPFVGCAIKLTDDDYKAGKGSELVGKTFLLIAYSVYPDYVCVHENGMIEI